MGAENGDAGADGGDDQQQEQGEAGALLADRVEEEEPDKAASQCQCSAKSVSIRDF